MVSKETARRAFALAVFALLIALWGSVAASKAAYATEWSKWKSPHQATFYTDYGATASGRIIRADSQFVAVDWSRVVSKKRWKAGTAKFRKTHFFYGERIQLERLNGSWKGRKRTLIVADCGSFGRSGQYWKGSWRSRWWDLTNGARLGFISWAEGVCVVRWRYEK